MEKALMILKKLLGIKKINYWNLSSDEIVNYTFKCGTDNISLDCKLEEVEKLENFINEYIKEFDKWCESVEKAM